MRSPSRILRLAGVPAIGAAIVYWAAAALLTWPVAARMDAVLFGDYGDTRGGAWWLWAKASGRLDGPVVADLAAPFGIPAAQPFRQPISEWLQLAVARAYGEIVALNAFVLLAFTLTALATYALLNRLLRDRVAAFFGGLVFGFCPAAVMQASAGHVSLAFNAFTALFVLALLHNRRRRNVVSAFWVAASFAGICFTSLYLGYFTIYLALYFVAFDLATREPGDLLRMVRNYLSCAAMAALIVVPVEVAAIRDQLTTTRESLARAGHLRDFGELWIYASRPWNYLVPSIDHPVLGRHFEDLVRSNLEGSNVFERTLYLGMVPLGLVVAGIVVALRGSFDPSKRFYFLFFSWGALWMYFVSLPPTIGSGAPTLSYVAYVVAPMFRVYARAGILVAMFVACAAAVVLAHMRLRMSPARFRAALAVLLPLLVFEYWSVPPGQASPVTPPPEVYRWLATQPDDFVIAEYPMIDRDEAAYYTYPFWQRIHQKRLVNGASPSDPRAWDLFEKVRDLGDQRTPALLRAAGARYVIVHKAMYRDGPIPQPIKRYYPPERAARTENGGKPPPLPRGLRLVRTFGSDSVYAVCETDC
jgi:hypothetical protein